MRVLFVCSECRPYAASGGLADVAGSLPPVLAQNALNIDVVMPLYATVKQSLGDRLTLVNSAVVSLDWRKQSSALYAYANNGVTYYFVECDYYYNRPNLYGYTDDIERFAFFSTAVVQYLGDKYDILHCQDWQSALVPLLAQHHHLAAKTVLTIHNIDYQGVFDKEHIQDLTGLSNDYLPTLEWNWQANLLKAGIVACDALTTVSPSYAREILTPRYASRLEGILELNKGKLSGILNGIDYNYYNPLQDNSLPSSYDATNVKGKSICKAQLCDSMSLDEGKPLFVCISRLAHHKGFDLITQALPALLHCNAQFVLLGTGDAYYEHFFAQLATSSSNCRAVIAFDNTLAKQLYAAADYFIMPSSSEPCGLSQMIACRYGALPIVHSVGGLRDSITNGVNGITFDEYSVYALQTSLMQAVAMYGNQQFCTMRTNAMRTDFSWILSAHKYLQLYRSL